ncbi:MAG: hypothetical protein M0037_07110 [Betaproteobacteria bacterium]|nr:hypothetical protein [Betaproteobacteria bacterium]
MITAESNSACLSTRQRARDLVHRCRRARLSLDAAGRAHFLIDPIDRAPRIA